MANVIALPLPRGADHGGWLPTTVRITELSRRTNAQGLVENVARILHGDFHGQVRWVSQHPDTRLQKGHLARVEWLDRLNSAEPAIPVLRLIHLDSALHDVNIFETVPEEWVRDRSIVIRAAAVWRELPGAYRAFLNELLWDSRRFYLFLTVPGSLNGHHNRWNGQLAHAVDVACRAAAIGEETLGISPSLLKLAGLIHDAGKAEEYRWSGKGWERTETGALIGHKDVLKGWIGAVVGRRRDLLPVSVVQGLWHTLFSARNAPAHLDIRESCMLEADILSMADRLSGTADLHMRFANPEGGFGSRHDHLRSRPYRLPVCQRA